MIDVDARGIKYLQNIFFLFQKSGLRYLKSEEGAHVSVVYFKLSCKLNKLSII